LTAPGRGGKAEKKREEEKISDKAFACVYDARIHLGYCTFIRRNNFCTKRSTRKSGWGGEKKSK